MGNSPLKRPWSIPQPVDEVGHLEVVLIDYAPQTSATDWIDKAFSSNPEVYESILDELSPV